jgi:hypothetical protein
MKNIMKFASLLLMSAVVLISCDKTGDDTNMDAGFQISSDKNVIQSNGEDVATFTAMLDGKDVTAETTFYLKDTMTPLEGNKLTADKVGTYNVIGMYGTFYKEEPVSVIAIDMPIPAAAEDPAASNTSFVHRAFLNQYTGTGCPNCPYMKRALKEAFKDEDTKNMAVLAAIHSYDSGDPAYFPSMRTSNYPFLMIDFNEGLSLHEYDPEAKLGLLKSKLEEITSTPAVVGISANPIFADDVLVVTVSVKAAQSGEYNLGVWLLQDNVYGKQSDKSGLVAQDPSYNYHDDCLRVADSRYSNSLDMGHPLGEIKVGETALRTFVFNIDKEAWKVSDMKNIHFAAYVTAKSGRKYSVVNVVDCSIDQPTPYEYK